MSPSHVTNNTLNCDIDSKNSELILETDRNSVSVTVFRPKPPKNMVSAWFRLRQKGTVELLLRPKLKVEFQRRFRLRP